MERIGRHMSLGEYIRQKISTLPWRFLMHTLFVGILVTIGTAVFQKPSKTNAEYLQELIEYHAIEKSATIIVEKLRALPESKDIANSEWDQIEKGLAECAVKKAREYLASNDPYLKARANMETPSILMNRFFIPCGGGAFK